MAQIIVTEGPYWKNRQAYIGDTMKGNITLSVGGTAVDLTVPGNVVKMCLANYKTGATVFTLTQGSGITVDASGGIEWKFTPAQTATFTPNEKMKYDLQWTNPNDDVTTLQAGIITGIKDVTPP